MSLTERLAERRQHATLSNRGCATCKWLATRSEQERLDINAWIDSGLSLTPLYEECAADGLPIRQSAFEGHVRRCYKRGGE